MTSPSLDASPGGEPVGAAELTHVLVPPDSPAPVRSDGAEQVAAHRLMGWWHSTRSSPLVRRITGYSAGSLIAAFTSELAFAAAFGVFGLGTTWSSLVGFVGGAVPNYVLNRRWAWKGRRGRSRRSELVLYVVVSVATFLTAAVVTEVAETWARGLHVAAAWRVMLVAGAYLAASGVFFAAKFVAYELVVFTDRPATRRA